MRHSRTTRWAVLWLGLTAIACRTGRPLISPSDASPAAGTQGGPLPVGTASLLLEPDPGPASARPLDPDLVAPAARPGGNGWIRVLVDLRRQVDLSALIESSRRDRLPRAVAASRARDALARVAADGARALEPLLGQLRARNWLDYAQPLRFRNRFFLSIRPEGLSLVQADPAIASIVPEFDSIRAARARGGSGLALARPVPPGDSWAVAALGLAPLWQQGLDGRGVVIGLLDTGVMPEHDALRDGWRPERGWADPERGSPIPNDHSAPPHGSQVLSTAVGRPVEGRAIGAAPAAAWVAARSNPLNGYNNITLNLAADWMLFEAQPDVILGAWGHGPGSCDPRDRSLLLAMLATGIVPVYAAGNDGPQAQTVQAPAALDYPSHAEPVVVGAIDRDGRVATISSRGPSRCGSVRLLPDLVAPGEDLPVPIGPTRTGLTLGTGTSYAVGWVAGTVAMMLQVDPTLRPDQVIEILRSTAREIAPEGPDPDAGYGLLDPAAAIAAVRARSVPANR